MKVAGDGGYIPSVIKHCHHQNDSCIKIGSDQSHFNVSLIVKAKSQDRVHRPQLLKRKESRSGHMMRAVVAAMVTSLKRAAAASTTLQTVLRAHPHPHPALPHPAPFPPTPTP